MVDAWTLMPSIYRGDPNRCLVGQSFVRVMWSNGLPPLPRGAKLTGVSIAADLIQDPDGDPNLAQ